MSADRPVCLLIGALGGEGGGVLATWLTNAALAADLPVQSTSIPGVAQRTGATAYYLEIYPQPLADLGGREPVFALFPNPATVDIVVASELLEAARAMERGFVTPDRTTLIASTHRIYAVSEKSVPSDGRFDATRAHAAAGELAKRAIMGDLDQLAQRHRTSLNAVMLGAIAGTGVLPIADTVFEAAVSDLGKAVKANLRGFRAGIALARDEAASSPAETVAATPSTSHKRAMPRSAAATRLTAESAGRFPEPLAPVIGEAIARLIDYQDARYAESYLARLRTVTDAEQASQGDGFGFDVSRELARQLAVWMSFEDVIRVADLKTRAARMSRVREEVGVEADDPLRITEFLKPGLEEWCGLLPAFVGRPLLRGARRRGLTDRLNLGLRVRTHTIFGFSLLFLLARLRGWRRQTLRYREEQEAIETWLSAVRQALTVDYRFAREVVELARLRKGYGETRTRGVDKFDRIIEHFVDPSLADEAPPVAAVRQLREAALGDADDNAFDRLLGQLAAVGATAPPKPTPERTAAE